MPHPTLVSFLEEKLRLSKRKKKLKEDGKDLTKEDWRQIRNNDKMKVHVLNNHVFRSMANLIAFFEYISGKHAEIRDDFEDDIRDLLLGMGADHAKGTAFARLFNAAMEWNYEKDPDNFRLILFDQILWLITTRVLALTASMGVDNKLIASEMDRARLWLNFYSGWANRSGKFDDREPSRPVLF